MQVCIAGECSIPNSAVSRTNRGRFAVTWEVRVKRLFVMQGLNRLDSHGPPGGNVTSCQRDDEKQDGYGS